MEVGGWQTPTCASSEEKSCVKRGLWDWAADLRAKEIGELITDKEKDWEQFWELNQN